MPIHPFIRRTNDLLSSPLLRLRIPSPYVCARAAHRMATPLARAPLLRAPLRPSPTAFRLALRRHVRPLVAPYAAGGAGGPVLRTCKSCKKQYDPAANHPSACRYHTAHFGGETKRKFESVYAGGTMDTPDSGKVFQYWHCCGSEDPFDAGCTAAPHCSYDD